MARRRYAARLLREIVALARQHKAYWIIPFCLVLGLAAFAIAASQTTGPFLYTLF